jgi:hypothetical protein
MIKRKPNYPDKRRRKMMSRRPASYAEIFLRVIKAGFGQNIKAEVYAPQGDCQMIVFYLEGKERQRPITRRASMTPKLRDEYRIGALFTRFAGSPITYHRIGFPKLPVVIVVRKTRDMTKVNAFRDADKVSAGIVEACMKSRIKAAAR